MEKPAVSNASGDAWFLGEGAADRNASLESLQAPNFTLKDLDGNEHSLVDFRGKKVLLATWASW
ncbi:MAG: redoxin domain-containing protein [Alphaproteobacteria bacterium]|nr:MAG: redoxin domain-containing protein [Alphaproteobacteria bacterium]